MNDKILNEVDSIITLIKDSKEYKEYLFLKEKLEKNEKAKSLIKEIKNLQKELVKKEAEGMGATDLDKKINDNLEKLNRIPLYVDFINIQDELNNIYQDIKNRLDDYFYDKLN